MLSRPFVLPKNLMFSLSFTALITHPNKGAKSSLLFRKQALSQKQAHEE